MLNNLIILAQIAISLILIFLILLQERSSGVGGAFGGGAGGFYQARRGLEKTVFISTIVLTVLFAGLALLNLVLPVA